MLALLAACGSDSGSNSGGHNVIGGYEEIDLDTVQTYMELSDIPCGRKQECNSVYLVEFHGMAVCDGDGEWVFGSLIKKLDCEFIEDFDDSWLDEEYEPSSSSGVQMDDQEGASCSSEESSERETESSRSSSHIESCCSSSRDGVSSSSVVSSSSFQINWPAGIKASGYYENNCPAGHTCTNAGPVEYLNQTMLASGGYGEFLDERDYKIYKVVMIEGQVWMAQNMNYGDSVANPNLKGSIWCGGGEQSTNEEGDCDKYGRLYTWAAAIDKPESESKNDAYCKISGPLQGICPDGWHLPSTEEVNVIFEKMGGHLTAGPKLMATADWNEGGAASSDPYGFSALPAGELSKIFTGKGVWAFFWLSSNSGCTNSIILYNLSKNALVRPTSPSDGESLRCVMD